MAYQVNLAPFFSGVVSDATAVTAVASKAGFYIQVVEQLGKALSLSTAQKQALFQNLLIQDLSGALAPVAAELKAAWPKVQGVVNAIISLFNLLGWAFAAISPIIEVAEPNSVPAITAINAAVAAVTAAGNTKASAAAPAPAGA